MTYIFIQASVLLRDRFIPYDLACREPHNDIDVAYALGHGIYIVTQTMALREQDLCQVFLLDPISACFPVLVSHTYLGGRR